MQFNIDDVTIISVRKTNVKNQACADITISGINNDKPFGYLLDLSNSSGSELHSYIKSKITSGEIELLPPFTQQEEYDSIILKSKIKQLLHETDQFMTIDTELTDDEVKEMKSYRASLRSIVKANDYKSLSKTGIPELPKFLKKDMYHITYIGSQTLEK